MIIYINDIIAWNFEHPGEDLIAKEILNPPKKKKVRRTVIYVKT